MRGEGERREGEDGSEDPFGKYADELDEKYEETGESNEKGAGEAASAPEQVAETHGEAEAASKDSENPDSSIKPEDESAGERGETGQNEFQAYAKELKERYNEDEGGTDSTQPQEDSSETEGKAATPERDVPRGQDGQSEDELKESAALDSRQRADPSEEKLTDVGGYEQIADNRKGDMDRQNPSSDSERPKDALADGLGPEKPTPAGDAEARADALPQVAPAERRVLNDGQRPQEKELQDSQLQKIEPKTVNVGGRTAKEPQTESSRAAEGKVPESIRESANSNQPELSARAKPIENELATVGEKSREIPVVLAGSEGRKDVYAMVQKTTFEESTGVKLERGKTYDIHFRIAGIGDSWTRHSESDYQERVNASNIRLHFSNAYTDRLAIGSRCNIAIDYVTDKRCLRVAETHQGAALKIHRGTLGTIEPGDGTGATKPVVELGIKNLSKRESRTDVCYATLHLGSKDPGRDVSRLMVGRLGARVGDIMEVQYTRLHSMRDFAENFNKRLPKSLENTKLAFEQGKLLMQVDGKQIPLLNPALKAYKLDVFLKAEIRSTGKPITFRVDDGVSKIAIQQRLQVVGIKAPDSGLSTSFRLERHRALMPKSFEHSYKDWKQVAGYFDGDGSPDFYVGKRVLHPSLKFVDNYRPHIMMIRRFLISEGLTVHKANYDYGGAWKTGIAEDESVRKMASEMLPYLYKKHDEVKAIVDYLDNRITGNQLAEVFNSKVEQGSRTGKIRVIDIPYTREEGQELSREEIRHHAKRLVKENQKLPDETIEQIRQDIASGVAGNGELAKKYGVSGATISRAVFGRTEKD